MRILSLIAGFVILFSTLCSFSAPGNNADSSGSKDAVHSRPAAPGKSPPMTDIFDIKPPEVFGLDPDILKWSICAALALLSVFALLFFLIRRRKKKRGPEIVILPETKAIELLNSLENEADMDGKIFYFRLSGILREYIKGRFNVTAPEMTAEELIDAIIKLELNKELKESIKNFASAADPIKFAGKPPVVEQMRKDLLMAKNFVRQTAAENKTEGN